MNDALETHRSFVNSWECDENVHMNIQFYWKRFGEAASIFFNLTKSAPQHWIDRHVRYHSELMMGTNTIVQSARGMQNNSLVHHLVNGDSNILSATAIDLYPEDIEGAVPSLTALPEASLPRSIRSSPLFPVDTGMFIRNKSGLVTHRCIVTPQECGADGLLLDQYHIARLSDAASHLWHHLGVTREWMRQENRGSVAVEMKASRHQEVRAGTILEVVTWVEEIRSKTFTFRHQVSDMANGQPLYSGAVTALLMDMKVRKAVELPSMMRQNT